MAKQINNSKHKNSSKTFSIPSQDQGRPVAGRARKPQSGKEKKEKQ